jgi:uncharacterized protein (DUF305 family)
MTIRTAIVALTAASLMLAAGQGQAQDTSPALPAICTPHAGHDMGSMQPQTGGMAMGAHADLMAGMAKMDADMMQGAMAEDIDVAFVCSMIPHHQGAIDMAKAELQHGDDPWAKQMAQKVIDAQEQEIADMLDWLQRQSK